MNPSTNRSGLGATVGALGISLLLGCTCLLAPAASAAESDGGKRFASVWRIRGDVVATAASGAERPLKEGDVVFVGEKVRAASAAEAVLKTEDAGIVAVRPGAEFVAEKYAAEGKSTDSFTVRLINGSLRVITGWIGRLNKAGHQVVTPQATIGIRGTDHEPYVLSLEMAKATSNREGTYDKVNRGGTTLDANGGSVDIDAGKVGFAPKPMKHRALMTILMPVLLEKVPEFYVPGEFDAELDRYSQTADAEAAKQLEQLRKSAPTAAPAAAPASCSADKLAKQWLARLDGAIVKRDANAVIAMFAPEVKVKATVRVGGNETMSVEMGRDELAQSTITAIKGLKDYQHRRISTEAKLPPDGSCDRMIVKSVVIEQGKQAGKPYRFESTEEYMLESRGGAWVATQAETTQR
ncbi:MAG TPA: hypothetical protein VFF03_03215 [Rhodocyclaceae bacterium]|nr:hypothetical protein [Rhodocyclaceae bacterium]